MHNIIDKTQSYAYFIDNDDHAKKKSARSTKLFEGKAKMNCIDAIEKIMYDSEIEQSHNILHEDSSSTCKSYFNLYHLLLF
jgi:hypothetical protein